MLRYLSKVGSDHIWDGKNNQDYHLIIDSQNEDMPSMKMVIDGCGSGRNSEVGVQLFAQLFYEEFHDKLNPSLFEEQVNAVMKRLISISPNLSFLSDNMFFTIVCVFELKDKFIAKVCGDGYLVSVSHDKKVEYISFDNGDYPKYVLYNFLPVDKRGKYQEGVTFDTLEFSKETFLKVGVATDGLRYYNELPDTEKYKFDEFMINGKLAQLTMLINRCHEKFKDDITICI